MCITPISPDNIQTHPNNTRRQLWSITGHIIFYKLAVNKNNTNSAHNNRDACAKVLRELWPASVLRPALLQQTADAVVCQIESAILYELAPYQLRGLRSFLEIVVDHLIRTQPDQPDRPSTRRPEHTPSTAAPDLDDASDTTWDLVHYEIDRVDGEGQPAITSEEYMRIVDRVLAAQGDVATSLVDHDGFDWDLYKQLREQQEQDIESSIAAATAPLDSPRRDFEQPRSTRYRGFDIFPPRRPPGGRRAEAAW